MPDELLKKLRETQYADPVSGIVYANMFDEDKYELTRGLDRLEFDPSLTFADSNPDNPEYVYDLIFNPIEQAYSKIMGKPLDLSSGSTYSQVWSKEENPNIEKELSKFIDPVNKLMDKDIAFSNNVIGDRRELLTRDFAKELYGIEKYITNHPAMPKEGSDDRRKMDKVIYGSLRNNWSNIQNMITSEVQSQGIRHSVDESYWKERAIPSAKKVIGETVKRFDDEIGSLLEFLKSGDGGRWGKRVEWGKEGEPEISSDGVENWAQRVQKFGDRWVKEAEETLSDPDIEPTGQYALAMGDLSIMDGILNPKYALATVSESAISNMLITGSGVVASIISPGKKLKVAAGILGSAIPGYALESSAAETEAIEELQNLRRQAKIDKANLSPEQFKSLYTYHLGENYTVTADQLSDENIADISNRIAQVYGILSAGVEGLSTGIEITAATKFFKDMTSAKTIGKTAAKGTLGKSIMKAKDIGKWITKGFGVEAVEEATQESLNQYIIQRNVPFYEFDPSRVWKAAYAGGLFGAGMSTVTAGVGQIKRQYEKGKMERGARTELEERREAAEEGADIIPEERTIKAGLFLEFTGERFVDRIAMADEENYQKRLPIISLRAGELAATRQEWMTPEEMVKILKDKKVRENFNITEQKLMTRHGYFTNEQVAEILGVDVADLQFEHSQIKRGKPAQKKKTKPKIKKNYSKPKRKGKKALEDLERTEMDDRSYEFNMLMDERNQLLADKMDLKEAIQNLEEGRTKGTKPREEVDAEIKRMKDNLKKLNSHSARIDKELKKMNSRKPKRKTKDPLAQKKQKLINQVNDLGDEAFTPDELATLKLISKAKTDKDLKKFNPIIEEAQKRVEKEVEAEGIIAPEEVNVVNAESVSNVKKLEKEGKGINILRKGRNVIEHFGNPFSHLKSSHGQIRTKNRKESIELYDKWLRTGELPIKLSPQSSRLLEAQREWILEQIDSGALDGKDLLYHKGTKDNHAVRLAAFIKERRGKKESPKQSDVDNAMDAFVAKDKEIENYDGDRRSKEFRQLRSEQKELGEALDLAMKENRGEALTDESLQNQAENIHDVLTSIGGSITYNRQQLEQMNDAKLIELADKEGIESSDRNTIIAQYLDNMGDPGIDELEQMNMGIPLRLPKILANRKERSQFFAELNEAWRQAKERHGLDDYAFDAWVDAIASRQPSNTRELFLEWAEHASPAQLNRAVDPLVDRVITGVLGRSDRFNPQEWDQIGEDIEDVSAQIKEAAPKINDEDSDLSAESENIINTRAFSAFQTNLNSEVFEHLVDSINSGAFETFEDFLNEISDPMYELMNQNGQTPVVAANENIITRNELMQFYVSKLPENFVPINQGNKPGVRKNIELVYLSRADKFGKKGVKYKTTKSGWVKTGWGRAMLAENLIEGINDDIVWLDKSDVKMPIGKGEFITRGEPLTAEELAGLTRNEFKKAKLIPLMMRNDSGRLILAIVKKEHKANALKYLTYWNNEVANGHVSQELADEYSGKNLSEKQMKSIYGSQHDYIAGQIARHETLKKIFGNSYHELTQQEIMLRNSVIFSTALSNKNGDPSSIYVFDYGKDRPGDVKFVTEFEDGTKETINAIQMIDGEYQYIGDGATWTSERVFSQKYTEEVGALATAKRAKTVKFAHDESGVLLEKHQEMTFSLPEGANKAQLIDGGLVVAEMRREADGVNIYVREEGSTQFKYVDHLASRDEAKVVTGKYGEKMNAGKIISMPSAATGHIQLTARDKNIANFPMQVLNYLSDENLLNHVNNLYNSRTGDSLSPEKMLFKMMEFLTDGRKMDDFIRKARISFPGSIPRMIENFADVGSGIHPASLSLAMAMVKNRVLLKSQDFLQRGGILDFRPSMTEKIADDEMIGSSDHGMRKHIAYQLAQKLDKPFKEINGLKLNEINALLKKNPIEIMMVRFPVPSQSGYRIMKVTKLEKGLGDSFKVNPKVVKEVFEGDHDHDTGHITILDPDLTEMLKANQVESVGIQISKYEQQEDAGSIANIEGAMSTMSALTQGKMAIGKIASLQRNYGVINHHLNHLVIDGSKIVLKSLDSSVTDPDMIIAATGKPEKQSLGMMLRTYAQAAFDNPKLRLLDKWNFSDKKLIGMMYQREDGKKLTEAQINTLSLYMAEHNKASQIRNGRSSSQVFTLSELLHMSKDYKEMVENREFHIVNNVGDRIEEIADDKPYGQLNSVSAKEGKVHPMETRAMAPYLKVENYKDKKDVKLDRLLDDGRVTSLVSHAWATARLIDDEYRVEMTAKAAGLTVEQFKQLDPKAYNEIQQEVIAGIDWGRAAHAKLLNLYEKTYDNLADEDQARPIDPNSWDHNKDFNDFYHNLYKDGLGGLSAYKDLPRTAQVAATFAFLDKFITSKGIHADYAGKILPVGYEGITLLDPEVMTTYFNLYNKGAMEHILGEDLPGIENIRATKVHETYVQELRRVYGCE